MGQRSPWSRLRSGGPWQHSLPPAAAAFVPCLGQCVLSPAHSLGVLVHPLPPGCGVSGRPGLCPSCAQCALGATGARESLASPFLPHRPAPTPGHPHPTSCQPGGRVWAGYTTQPRLRHLPRVTASRKGSAPAGPRPVAAGRPHPVALSAPGKRPGYNCSPAALRCQPGAVWGSSADWAGASS